MKYNTLSKILLIIDFILVIAGLLNLNNDYWFWRISAMFFAIFSFNIGLQVRPKLEE